MEDDDINDPAYDDIDHKALYTQLIEAMTKAGWIDEIHGISNIYVVPMRYTTWQDAILAVLEVGNNL